jgi:hypothetical protein
MPGRVMIELTPQAAAQVRDWLLLLAADDAAPTWRPAESYDSPAPLRAAAHWLVDNGHGGGLDAEVVAVLLALFSIGFRAQLEDETEGRLTVQRSMLVSVSDLERVLRDRAPGIG